MLRTTMIRPTGEPLSVTLKDLRLPPSTISAKKDLLYFTAVHWNTNSFGLVDLQTTIDDFSSRDDVWSHLFLDFVLLLTPNTKEVQVESREIPSFVHVLDVLLADGPYIAETTTGRIYAAGCQYEDSHAAFVSGNPVVKSRLYHKPDAAHPLAGLRFAVKDIIDVRGLPTTCGNGQYGELYGPRESTAACVQRLVEAGAEFVGKTKMAMFASGVNSACNWTDTLCPFNPRGDGYQVAQSSSTGSAVACAAYYWIDFAIGTDTGGSVRYPAAVNGVYGIRPSSSFNCEESRKHIMIASKAIDTIGVLARDSEVLRQVTSFVIDPQHSSATLLNSMKMSSQGSGIRILYPTADLTGHLDAATKWFQDPQGGSYPVPNPIAAVCMEKFVASFETLLQTNRIPFNFADLWRRTHPADLPESIDEAMHLTYRDNVYYESARNFVDPFISDWKADFKKREPQSAEQAPKPFIIPEVEIRIDYGRSVTDEQYAAANFTRERFAQWVRDVLFRHFLKEDERSLLILPRTWGLPDYRFEDNTPRDAPVFPWTGFQPANISGFSDCPDLTVPVGEVPYHSKVTDRREWLPCSVGILAQPGDDGLLFDVLQLLEEKAVLRPLATGARMYQETEPSLSSRL